MEFSREELYLRCYHLGAHQSDFLSDNDIIHTVKIFKDIYSAEDDIFFVAKNIELNINSISIEGSLGYSYDPTFIKLLLDTNKNEIIINSCYRLMHLPAENELYKDDYKMTKTHPECKLIDVGVDCIPYYRFPRSKDGISIPRGIQGIFKIYESNIKPKILIPSEWYTYNAPKFITA